MSATENPRRTPGSAASKRGVSPANSFGRMFLSQDQDVRGTPLRDITAGLENDKVVEKAKPANKKRTRLLLDARTELTDEELKVSRSDRKPLTVHSMTNFANR